MSDILNKSQAYALTTAAYNEEKLIRGTIESVCAQTLVPTRWIIVSDGSTDRTDAIVRSYAACHSFIELYRITEDHPRNFTAQVNAINAGFSRLKAIDCDFIGNLDADITLPRNYFESLLPKFSLDLNLGLAGGFIYEESGGKFCPRRTNSITSVAHGVQLFRRECLDFLGGYQAFSWGGTDTHAGICLQMKGWHVESFPELHAFHHRPTGQSFGSLRYGYRGGLMDFYFGIHPLFEMFRLLRRIGSKPYVIAALVRFAGFMQGYCSGAKREVPPEFIEFLRKDEMRRLRRFLVRGVASGKINSYSRHS